VQYDKRFNSQALKDSMVVLAEEKVALEPRRNIVRSGRVVWVLIFPGSAASPIQVQV